jgi:hypothetical protein
MPDSIFSGSRSKIRWAKEHLKNLHDRWRVFETGTYLISVKQDAETGDDFLELDTSHIIPDDFLLITGDVIHNLMAALDYAMNDVEFAAINTRRRHTKFPVRNTKDELIATVNGGLKDKAREQVKNFIINDVQPYNGGNGNFHRAQETIADGWHCNYVARLARIVPQHSPQRGDTPGERVVGDGGLIPNRAQDFVLSNHPAGVAQEKQKHAKCLRLYRDGFVPLDQ